MSASGESDESESDESSEITLSTMKILTLNGQNIRTDLTGSLNPNDVGVLNFEISTQQECVNENVWFKLSSTKVWQVWEQDTWSNSIDQEVTDYFEEHFVKSECSEFWFVFLEDAV